MVICFDLRVFRDFAGSKNITIPQQMRENAGSDGALDIRRLEAVTERHS